MVPAKISILSSLLLVLLATAAEAQTPAAAASPSPAAAVAAPATTDIIQILKKAGQFTTFIKLLKGTLVSDQINSQLSGTASSQGITVFAPTDNAFAGLKTGTLNSLAAEQQLRLVQYHVLPAYYSLSQFQTATNPLHTQAGNSDDGEYPLNVTADASGSQVNVSTGVVSATVSNTVYSDAGAQLAVFAVDKVLLPLDIFGAPASAARAPAPAPAAAAAEKPAKSGDDDDDGKDPDGAAAAGNGEDSAAGFRGRNRNIVLGLALAVLFLAAF